MNPPIKPWHRHTILALIATLLLSACATNTTNTMNNKAASEPDFSAALPDVTAQYLSSMEITDNDSQDKHHQHKELLQHQWRFWRQQDLLVRDNLDTRISDVWQRDGKVLIQKKLFHNEQRGVEFQPADLRLLNIEPQWQKLALLFDTALLPKLKRVDSGWRNGVPFQRYEGHVDNADWIIELRTDLILPLLIEYKSATQHETIKLINCYPLKQSPWQTSTGDDYNMIDFADLGDMEYDPFVKKVESLLGGIHHH